MCVFPSQSLFEMVSELQGDPGYPLGRFGAAITALTDINGDGLTDVAVGAPLEEQGAVYIFNGKPAGLSPQASQVRHPACPSNRPTRLRLSLTSSPVPGLSWLSIHFSLAPSVSKEPRCPQESGGLAVPSMG